MEFWAIFVISLALTPATFSQKIEDAAIVINTTMPIANTDTNYICATIDWWPHDKCNYDQCPWGYSSVINLNLSHPLLSKAIQGFKHLRLRLGGSLQDQVRYQIVDSTGPCNRFRKEQSGLFGFSKGCLSMKRWDELNNLFKKTGAIVTFGLNALNGRRHASRFVYVGEWNSSNAREFIRYTISKGYLIDSWEFGNELSGHGIGASVGAEQYARDVIKLNAIIEELYKNVNPKPLVLAPGGFYDKEWFTKFLKASGPRIVDAMTHHIYNLGAGNDHNLVNKILNPQHLSKISYTFGNLSNTIQTSGPWTSAWVGEAGGAFNSGGRNVSNTFVNSFWYLDQLGMAAKYNTKVYCRQTLVGGNYGLLDSASLAPNPDYYSALMFNQLMGKGVLDVSSDAPYLRSYAHCTRERAGVTFLLINLSNDTEFRVKVESSRNNFVATDEATSHKHLFIHGVKRTLSWIGSKASDLALSREEYHLTPEDRNIHSRTIMLNGQPLQLTDVGDVPSFPSVLVDVKSAITISPLSIKFIVFPNLNAPGCR
ncbi:hypothetical protein Leryth_024092 [Lithospermum erythrorhizon]|nr:hypothetical protein Leryth_024092 [Lithospermum erythrorhizon]